MASRNNRSLADTGEHVLNTRIRNVHPAVKLSIIADLTESSCINRIVQVEGFIRDKLQLHNNRGSRTLDYWTNRGWDISYAYIQTRMNKPVRNSPFGREFWLSKINPATGVSYTADEADTARNSRRPIMKEYWISRGYSESDAVLQAAATKTANNERGSRAAKNSKIRNATNKRCIEYYTARGNSIADSITMQSSAQRMFSKDICIEKFGVEAGIAVWAARQAKWKESLKKSGIHLGISKASARLFDELAPVVPGLLYGPNEVLIRCGTAAYSVDCMLGTKIIEFQGDYWHANPAKYSADSLIKLKRASDIWQYDSTRRDAIESQGYTILVVWDSETTNDLPGTINKCLNFLTQ